MQFLLFKSGSNSFLEPTSTEQQGLSFLLKETTGPLMTIQRIQFRHV